MSLKFIPNSSNFWLLFSCFTFFPGEIPSYHFLVSFHITTDSGPLVWRFWTHRWSSLGAESIQNGWFHQHNYGRKPPNYVKLRILPKNADQHGKCEDVLVRRSLCAILNGRRNCCPQPQPLALQASKLPDRAPGTK